MPDRNGPAAGDYILGPAGQLGGQTAVWQRDSRYIGTFSCEPEALEHIRNRMERQRFWPDVWRRDDHGGDTLITEDD